MSKQVNYNENLCSGAAIRDDKGRRISKLFEASHPKMTVGYAKNLIMPDTPTEQEFNFRQSGGGVIEDGVAVIDKVKGNSVVWNQIIAKPYTFGLTRESTFSSWYDGGSRSINDKGQFVFITNGETTGIGNALNITPKNTHKYLLSYKVKADVASVCTVYQNAVSGVIANIAEADKWYFVSYIGDNNDTGEYSSFLNAVVAANSPETTVTIDNAKVTDLTQMFGAGNEPSTVEEFLSRKPKVADEYAYNEGTIVNSKVEEVVTTGINLWDEQWESGSYDVETGEKVVNSNYTRNKNFIRVIPSSSIYFRATITIGAIYILFYDREQKYLSYTTGSNRIINIPSNCCYINIVWLNSEYGSKTYNHDICINLSDPSINGQYFPYEKHELDLSWVKDIKDTEGVKLFEDGIKSAGTAYDEVAKGRAIKKIGVKVFDGTEEWNLYSEYSEHSFRCYGYVKGKEGINNINNKGYTATSWNVKGDKLIFVGNGNVVITDSVYNSESAWKQHLADLYAQGNPLVVYYELADPIEVEYDEKNLTYPVVAGGTEEAIASEPSTAFRADIGYGIDAVKTILDLKARVDALERK